MKKLICLLAVSILALATAVSCDDNKYGDHKFFTQITYSINSYERLLEISRLVDDEYFRSVITKTGYFKEVCPIAIEEFRTHCRALDAEKIEAQLIGTEWYAINFWSMDPAQNWISYVYTAGNMTVKEN